jgi:hypothetical protein
VRKQLLVHKRQVRLQWSARLFGLVHALRFQRILLLWSLQTMRGKLHYLHDRNGLVYRLQLIIHIICWKVCMRCWSDSCEWSLRDCYKLHDWLLQLKQHVYTMFDLLRFLPQ